MNAVFVWTLSDLIPIGLLGIFLAIGLICFLFIATDWVMKKVKGWFK